MQMSPFSAACLVYAVNAAEAERLTLLASRDGRAQHYLNLANDKCKEVGKILVSEALKHGH